MTSQLVDPKKPLKIPVTVAGIPAIAEVTYALVVPSDPSTWDSDLDYHGYSELEFRLLDRKGYPADWLERKLADPETSRLVSEQIWHELQPSREDDYDI